jgi:TnpA family transposase
LAIREVINAVISIRDPAIFGTATTTVACDSKKLNSWDQNLMNEWHGRYKGHGVMVYWHVDTNALCIHSQSKTCTSSEVGAMIKGILEHSTKMDLNAAYVDTHGQSTIGFGVGKLLNFELLPRLKNIHKQKLYMVSDSDKQSYTNLTAILKDSIQWKHIEADYHEAVKHIVALKHGLVEADVFVKRFSKDNYKHPAYKALCEIGKATKTIFLCKYLQQEELRIEINAGLNVVERLNGVMNFFFYGKLGEINSNDPDEQELSILCLHLLQACSVYINTLLIQEILSDPYWRNKLTPEDYRALSPLIHSHFNPYGIFLLDLEKRLMINIKDFG